MTATTMPTPTALAMRYGTPYLDEQLAQALAERGAGKGAGKHADQRDADLHGRQEAARDRR